MNDTLLNKNIIEAIRSAYAAPTPESTSAKAAERQGVMARTQSKVSSALEDTARDALASVESLIGKTMDARTDKDISMKELGKLVMDATDPQEPAPVSEDPDRQFSGSGVDIEDRFPETNLSDIIADESTAPLSEVDPERRDDEEFLRTGVLPTAETGEGLMSPVPPVKSLRPKARPIDAVVEEVKQELPPSISNKVESTEAKTSEDVNIAIFDATTFSGEIPTPKKGADPIKWIAENTYGLNENDPVFRKAMRSLLNVDPKKTPWCAAFAGYILKGLGVGLPERATQNPNLAFNYVDLGEDVYNHNPTTGKTYKGSVGDVRPGDVIVFNNGGRQKDGSFKYGSGHISFVVGTEEDGSIIAIGGNQGGGTKVTTTRYTPDIVKKYYKGGFTVRRVNDGALEKTDPAVIAAITKDISKGGAER